MLHPNLSKILVSIFQELSILCELHHTPHVEKQHNYSRLRERNTGKSKNVRISVSICMYICTPFPESIMQEIQQAARVIQSARSLIITAGAGMGVDSGLPDFRGNQGFWNAYPALEGYDFEEMANPQWFFNHPERAWEFYGHRLHLYRTTIPHLGFDILRKWTQTREHFIYTSNVDGAFQKSGFSAEKIVECHGSIHHLQYVQPDTDKSIWSANNTQIEVDEELVLAAHPSPTSLVLPSAPNILMFEDDEWLSHRTDEQESNMLDWMETVKVKDCAIIELGAGTSISTIRRFSTTTTFGYALNPYQPQRITGPRRNHFHCPRCKGRTPTNRFLPCNPFNFCFGFKTKHNSLSPCMIYTLYTVIMENEMLWLWLACTEKTGDPSTTQECERPTENFQISLILPLTQIHADLAYDGEKLWMVYNLPNAENDFDVYLTALSCTGEVIWGPTQIVDIAGLNQTTPRIAISQDRILVAAQADSGSAGNNLSIYLHLRTTDGEFSMKSNGKMTLSRPMHGSPASRQQRMVPGWPLQQPMSRISARQCSLFFSMQSPNLPHSGLDRMPMPYISTSMPTRINISWAGKPAMRLYNM